MGDGEWCIARGLAWCTKETHVLGVPYKFYAFEARYRSMGLELGSMSSTHRHPC